MVSVWYRVIVGVLMSSSSIAMRNPPVAPSRAPLASAAIPSFWRNGLGGSGNVTLTVLTWPASTVTLRVSAGRAPSWKTTV
jgi:hypothetical protein